MVLEGICFEVGTTDFNEAIKLCESAFDETRMFQDEWKIVKRSGDFKELSAFLKTHHVKNDVFEIPLNAKRV